MNNNGNNLTGAVLVQGGGIAGVQASLDLANSGFKVYLIERSAAIGGMMSHLDKTFPTGDCATCIVSPKLVECARNLNIEIHTLSELAAIEGEPGHFTVKVKKSPRYVDEVICNDCGDCEKVCPVDIKDPFNRYLGTRKAIAKKSAQAVPSLPSIIKTGHAPCKIACPANINVQGYVQLIKKKEYAKAVALIRERNPLSAICGRVCTHPCETVCTRKSVDAPVAIRQLKRFASDQEMAMIESGELALPGEQTPSPDAKKVAVIGAGPSGLTVANDLAGCGYAVTIYESASAAGGMLRWGIPEYRLPQKILDFEIDLIRRKGVVFEYNCQVGKDIAFEKIKQGNDAVFIAIGVQKGFSLGVKGEDSDGVIQGLDFLKQASTDDQPKLSGHVIVLGGGDVAMDAASTAIRLGAEKVTIVYRRTANELPAIQEEIDHAVEEGVNFQFLTAPVGFIADDNNKLHQMECMRMELGEPDESGRRRPVPIQGSEFVISANTAIIAIGSGPDNNLTQTDAGISVNKWQNIIIDHHGKTSVPGIFAGGDIVTGAKTVIEAVAAGKVAAESIDMFLRGDDNDLSRFENTVSPVPEKLLPSTDNIEKVDRAIAPELSVEKRIENFAEIEQAFSEAHAITEAEKCLNCAQCSECGACTQACEKRAVIHEMQEQTITLPVGAVILAPGFEEFHAEVKGEFGFGRYQNVMTSVQFERMLSAGGPSLGHVARLSDGRDAKSIAWIQCVGSRDRTCGNEYCSSICCMATTKQAMVAKEHVEGLEATVFYMDIRAFGKDFDQYYERAKNEAGVKYIKSIPSRIIEMPGTKDLRMKYVDDKQNVVEKDFDLVVLSVGLDPKNTVSQSIAKLGIELNEYGFCDTDRFAPLETSKKGVYVAGSFQEPKDIPETVTQASASSSMAMELLAQSRNSLVTKKHYPIEHDVSDEEPRIGVFVCHCGINIASVVDVKKVAQEMQKEPGVVMTTDTMYACADANLADIKAIIEKHRLNRIVVASCSPRTHEPLFRETMREGGLNPYLFELANIRDQCSWVHAGEPEAATQKAIELVRMSIARARLLSPIVGESMKINQAAMVIGGGLSGMTSALSLADQGFIVHLVERTGVLGGNLLNIHRTLEHKTVEEFTRQLIDRVKNNKKIKLHLETQVSQVAGHVGKFNLKLQEKSGPDEVQKEVSCGAIIVATGAQEAETKEYLMGQSENIMTQMTLAHQLHENRFNGAGKNIVMIQCVGSRNNERPYCSRVCCSKAVMNAIDIKEKHPDANVFVLFRDIRTYGFRESYYTKARQAGVIFIRFDENNPPNIANDATNNIENENGLLVSVNSPDFSEPIEIETDFLVLSTGIKADDENSKISELFKLPRNGDGFFVEAHMKLRPVDFATEGIFLCGLAHSPKFIDENISQARAAAARATTVLSKTHLEVGAMVSRVDQSKCISCMTCVKACPYGAPFVNKDNKAQVAGAKCMGCGICASECPARAIGLQHFESTQFNVMLENLFQDLKN